MSKESPSPEDSSPRKEEVAGDRASVALSEGDSSSARSSLSISSYAFPLPDDFDIKRYENEKAVAKVIQIQSFLRQVSVQQHFNLICASNVCFFASSPFSNALMLLIR